MSLQNKEEEKAAQNYVKTKLAQALGRENQILGSFSVKLLQIKGEILPRLSSLSDRIECNLRRHLC